MTVEIILPIICCSTIVLLVTVAIVSDLRLDDTMSIKEEEKIIKLFKKYGIEQTGSGMTRGIRYVELYGSIYNSNELIHIKVIKKNFKIVFNVDCLVNMTEANDTLSVKVITIRNFNKVFSNGIINYFEKEMKIKNKLNRIKEINSVGGEYEC